MMQAAILLGQHGDRRVVAHAARGFDCILHHRVQNGLELLERHADCKLAPAQSLAGEVGRLRRVGFYDMVDLAYVRRPFPVGMARGQHVAYRLILQEAPIIEIHADHLARPDVSLLDDIAFFQHDHAGFRTDNEHAAARHRIAQGPEPVSIKPRDHPAPIRRAHSAAGPSQGSMTALQ